MVARLEYFGTRCLGEDRGVFEDADGDPRAVDVDRLLGCTKAMNS